MNEIIELENVVNDEGVCVLHLMSNNELDAELLKQYNAPVDARFEIKKEIGAYHLRASWPMRGPLNIQCEGWPVPRMFVMWNLTGCESVTMAIHDAVNCYQDIFNNDPLFVFIRHMPRNVENGVEVCGLLLFEADWMVRKCVAVG